jgi:PAS domain S-box-containing protein
MTVNASRTLHRIGWLAFGFWSLLCAFAWGVQIMEVRRNATDFAHAEALAAFNKDLAYRRWAAGFGGVYVPVTDSLKPNPYLANVPNRDLTTTQGIQLTLINPAWMTRQVTELAKEQYGIQGHITSLKPLRPENAPDAWEREALLGVEQGREDVHEISEIGGVSYFRYLHRLEVEPRCLKCHASQGYKVGETRGGISVSVPMDHWHQLSWRQIRKTSIGYGLLWLFGSLGIGLSTRRMSGRAREREILEADKAQIEKMYRDTFDRALDGVYLIDRTGRILDANTAAEIQTGIPRERLRELGARDVWKSVDWTGDSVVWKRLDASESFAFGEIHERAGGQRTHASLVAHRLVENLYQLVSRDETSFVRVREEKSRLDKQIHQLMKVEAIGRLAGGIAHDFNNQLTGMMGYSELILMSEVPREVRDYAERMLQSVKHSMELTGQLLSFARQRRAEMAPLSLREITADLGTFLRHSVPAGIEIKVEPLAEELWVLGERSLIQNALLNLAINARDAMPQGGVLSIQTRLREVSSPLLSEFVFPIGPGNYVEVSVTDSGMGMDSNVREHLFEPFFTTKSGARNGTGLGLASVLSTMQRHGGSVCVESGVGRGSVFRLLFPQARAPIADKASQEVSAVDPALPQGRGRVLVVDDEPIVRALIRDALTMEGHEIVIAEDGIEAIEKFREAPASFNLVLLDVIMPRMDGGATLSALRAIDPGVAVVMMSGFSPERTEEDWQNAGALGLMRKPFVIRDIQTLVARSIVKRANA